MLKIKVHCYKQNNFYLIYILLINFNNLSKKKKKLINI